MRRARGRHGGLSQLTGENCRCHGHWLCHRKPGEPVEYIVTNGHVE
ncbi:MAG: hypothetical protein ACLS8R_10015 [Anaeromassilibacillus sp.]